MTDQEQLLIRLLRMRTDVGHLTLAHTVTGEMQASFKAWSATGYRCEIDADPIAALVRCMGPVSGQTLDQLEASIVKPTFSAVPKAAKTDKRKSLDADLIDEPTTPVAPVKKKAKLDDDLL